MLVADDELRPNLAVLAVGGVAISIVSAILLPWPVALASALLGTLMIAGAEVDARTLLLPDLVTYGATAGGIVAAAVLDPLTPWPAAIMAAARAITVAGTLAALRWVYLRLRGCEGLGLGDVKLAAAVGAWLPLTSIPLCFGLAAGGALVAVMSAMIRGDSIETSTKIPFGAFLCPALWLTFYASVLSS
jgi:leader peptidase (prepilin peptidase) / N-methyltransferase